MNALLTLVLSGFTVASVALFFAEGVSLLVRGFFKRNLAADIADAVVAAWRRVLD